MSIESTTDLAQRLRQGNIEDHDLDPAVLQHCRRQALAVATEEAAKIQGLEARVKYLLEQGETPATVMGWFGLEAEEDPVEGALAHCAQVLCRMSDDEAHSAAFGEGGMAHAALHRAWRVLAEQAERRRGR